MVKQFYAGLEETADFLIKVIKDMGLEDIVRVEKVDVDGECEVIVETKLATGGAIIPNISNLIF